MSTWSTSPDPVDFRDFQRIDLTKPDANMFVDARGEKRPIARQGGKPVLFYKPFSDMEEVMGHGGQLASFEAVFSARGPDGRPRKLWDRTTGAMTPAGVHATGTSPSCLALNAPGTRLYSANETDRVGKGKEGTVSAFSVGRADGRLKLLNTVRSGGAGPTHVSVHPSGKFLLVANYFGGSVAVLPILPDGRLGAATDIKNDAGKIGPTRATNAPPGSFAFSGHDRTHAHMIQADPSGRFVLHADLGLDKIFVWKFDGTGLPV